MRIAIVGAGIVGLAAAHELARDPTVELRCYEAGVPMSARSTGDTRIFRTAHGEARYVAFAAEASNAWRQWADEFGRSLVGAETTIVNGPTAPDWAAAMNAAGVGVEVTDDLDPGLLPTDTASGPFLRDPAGGVLALRTAGELLGQRLTAVLRSGDRVLALQPRRAGGVDVSSTSGTWTCDVVLILAGAGTPTLAASAGIDTVPRQRRHHHRFTFRLRRPGTRPACWLDQSQAWRPGFTSYQHLVGPGRWAIGGSLDAADTAEELGADETGRRAREVVGAYAREMVRGVEDAVVDTVHCDSMGLGDGVQCAAEPGVLALWGDNLAKFAPLLGRLLARSATAAELAPDLVALGPEGTGSPVHTGSPVDTGSTQRAIPPT